MQKRARAFVAAIQCINFSCSSCHYKVLVHFSNAFLACEGVISKRYFLERNCSSSYSLSYDIQLIQWSGCFRKVNIYMTYYIKQPRITQEVRVIIKGQPYVTHDYILSFQVVSGRFLLAVGRFRSFQVVPCFSKYQVSLCFQRAEAATTRRVLYKKAVLKNFH